MDKYLIFHLPFINGGLSTNLIKSNCVQSLLLTWINGASNNSAQWIPSSVIEPVMKLIEPFFCQETGSAVVEVSVR